MLRRSRYGWDGAARIRPQFASGAPWRRRLEDVMEIPPSFDSKFRFILVAANRARRLHAGARVLLHTPYKKTTKIAVAELEAGLVPFEMLPDLPGSEPS